MGEKPRGGLVLDAGAALHGNGASEIRGTIELGSIELPLVLRRGGKPS